MLIAFATPTPTRSAHWATTASASGSPSCAAWTASAPRSSRPSARSRASEESGWLSRSPRPAGRARVRRPAAPATQAVGTPWARGRDCPTCPARPAYARALPRRRWHPCRYARRARGRLRHGPDVSITRSRATMPHPIVVRLGERRNGGVVIHEHRNAQPLAENLAKGKSTSGRFTVETTRPVRTPPPMGPRCRRRPGQRSGPPRSSRRPARSASPRSSGWSA